MSNDEEDDWGDFLGGGDEDENNNKSDKDKEGTDGYRTPPRQKLTIDTNTSDTKRNRMRTTSRGSTYYEELDDTALSNLRSPSKRNKKEIRVFMEGAFDVMHYGHACEVPLAT